MNQTQLHELWDNAGEKLKEGLDLSKLDLTRDEADAMESASPELLDYIEEQLSKIQFPEHQYMYRDALVYKVIAHIMMNRDQIMSIIRESYNSASEVTGNG